MTTDNSTIRMRPYALHLFAQATEALAAIGLTIAQANALADAVGIAHAAQDPEQWESGATYLEIVEAWCEDAYSLRSDELADAGVYLLVAGQDD